MFYIEIHHYEIHIFSHLLLIPLLCLCIFLPFQLVAACNALNGCFQCLAGEYPHVKFCVVDANDVDLSQNFVSTWFFNKYPKHFINWALPIEVNTLITIFMQITIHAQINSCPTLFNIEKEICVLLLWQKNTLSRLGMFLVSENSHNNAWYFKWSKSQQGV